MFLAKQELGVGGDRAARQLGQAGEDRLGFGRTPECPVGQGQLITGFLGGPLWKGTPPIRPSCLAAI